MIPDTPPSVSKGRRPLVVRGRSGGGASKEAPRLRHFFASLSFAVERKRHKPLEPLWIKILSLLRSRRAADTLARPKVSKTLPGTPRSPRVSIYARAFFNTEKCKVAVHHSKSPFSAQRARAKIGYTLSPHA